MNNVKTAVRLVATILIIGIILLGIETNTYSPYKKTVGNYTVETYLYGITLSNDYRSFYNVTPFNFYTESQGSRNYLFDWEQNIGTKEYIKNQNNKIYRVYNDFFNSLNLRNPKATIGNGEDFVITTEINGDNIFINYESTYQNFTHSITFSEDDLVFDNNLTVYSLEENNYIEEVNNNYSLNFNNNIQEENPIVEAEFLYLTNLDNPGVIRIPLSQFEKTTVFRNGNLVEFTSEETPKLKLKVFNNIQEALSDD